MRIGSVFLERVQLRERYRTLVAIVLLNSSENFLQSPNHAKAKDKSWRFYHRDGFASGEGQKDEHGSVDDST